ncbi:BTAD domain-containing putative transcriptional regulator [Nocardia sp. NPDC024068]|uniref:AfsR/SARP family transcriptional regulator n=1 Tax=Nocardia sp. NPDC024068 TaxID=3157197 RepID=UPI0033D17284
MERDPGRSDGPTLLNPVPAGESLVVAVLGRIALRRETELVAVPGARARSLLVALALRPGRSRTAAALIEEVWGEEPPRAPMNALHTQVSRLRAALPDGVLEAGPGGYRLALRPGQVDLTAVAELIRQARASLQRGDPAAAQAAVLRARALWSGEPGADMPAGPLADELAGVAADHAEALDDIDLAAREALGDLDGAVALGRARMRARPVDETTARTLMRLLATAGRGNEALDVFATLRAALAAELGTDPGPAVTELNTAILRGRFTAGGPPTPGRAPADPPVTAAVGVRAAPNALLGRADDLAELSRLLRVSRVVTVLGPGGAGKTRLANEIGTRIAAELPVVLVELASVRPEGAGSGGRPEGVGSGGVLEIETAIATAMGLGEAGRERGLPPSRPRPDTARRLRDALSARPMLLVLDNCEHLIDAAADAVADLVGSCPQLTVLTTSRGPLAITAETVYPLAPLAIDPAGSPATDLFTARARAVRPSVRLDMDVVARLCHKLDGLPLAIELAAVRARTMSVEDIERRLDQRFALLRTGDRTSPERHRTLHAVIEWSWNLLEPAQRVTLRRMCRFPAGFTLAAAESVAGGAEVGDISVAVDGLVAQSLLTVVEEETEGSDPRSQVRYRMLETVREFGEQQLTAADDAGSETALVEARMARWACEFAVAVADDVRRGDQLEPALRMAVELDNLVAVLRRALAVEDRDTVYTVFPVVAMRWVVHGAHLEFMSWIPRLSAVAPPARPYGVYAELELLGHALTALHMAFMNRDLRELARTRHRVRTLLRTDTGMSEAFRFQGRLLTCPAGGIRLARLLARGVRSADTATRAIALVARANIWENMGRIHGSRRDGLAATALYGESEVWSRGMVAQHLGSLAGQTGHYRESVAHYENAAALLRRIHAYEESLEVHSYLAISLAGMGETAAARREIGTALGLSGSGARGPELIDDPGIRFNHRLAMIAAGLAEIELAEGDTDAGLGHFRRALQLMGWPFREAAPGPGTLLMCSANLAAHVLAGRVELVADVVPAVTAFTATPLEQVPDLPRLGTVACALGSALLALDERDSRGAQLLALAPTVVPRQDFPVMRWKRHHDLWRPRLGSAWPAVGQLTRGTAGARIVELLGEVAARGPAAPAGSAGGV